MRLMKPLVFAAILCLMVSPALFAQCPQAGSLTFATTLSGSQFGGQGAASGFGNGFITINPMTNQANVNLNVGGIGSNITNAGLFSNGSLAIPFTNSNTTFNNGNLSTTISLTPGQVNSILSNPGSFNFGVQTAEFPNGALNGSLMPLLTFGGTLSGTQVVGSGGATSGGGAFTAQLVPNGNGNGFLLNTSVTPNGIGGSLTGITLGQGATGTNGTTIATISNGGTLTNGQFTASTPLTNAQALALMTNPGNFFLTTNTANGALRSQFGAVQNELFIPVAGAVSGASGSQWLTDVNIFNESFSQPATVTVQFLPANQSNVANGGLNTPNATTITIAPRTVSAQTGILNNLFSIANGLGALRLVSDQPIAATARIYNDQRALGRGTLGEVLAAMNLCQAYSRGVIVGIANSASGSTSFATRTNIGFFNPTGAPVQVNLLLRNNSGAIAATNTLTIPAFGMMQLPSLSTNGGGVFNNVANDVTAGAIAYQSSAPIFAYASINDNASGDTSLVFAQPDVSAQPIAGTDADVAAIVTQADQGEVQLSQLGNRARSVAVQQFAQQMVTAHSADLANAQSLFASLGISASATNATVTALQAQNQTTMTNLNGMNSGTAWDRSFMQAEVAMHQQVLGMLDTMLIPSATSSRLQQFLQTERANVASHLAQAQSILAGLQ